MSEWTGLAARVREAARKLSASGAIDVDSLCQEAGIQTYDEKRRLYRVVGDLMDSGELKRVERGIYLFEDKAELQPARKADLMWRLIRRQPVKIQDLQTFAGASRDYVREWLQSLVKQGVARKNENGTYQLIKSLVEMPRNTKAERLRELRRKRREAALRGLRAAKEAIEKAERLIQEMEGEESLHAE
ncbi:MAG: hypothetical protein ABFD97_12840 [Syntrophobacter sp.]